MAPLLNSPALSACAVLATAALSPSPSHAKEHQWSCCGTRQVPFEVASHENINFNIPANGVGDVWELPNRAAFLNCDFGGAYQHRESSPGRVTVTGKDSSIAATRFFASKQGLMGNACNVDEWGLKVEVSVRPSATQSTDYCASNGNPCQNGGVCISTGNHYRCSCTAGFEGGNCQTNINDCSPNPCQNGGACTDQVNNYSCACAAGYTGARCEVMQSTPDPGTGTGMNTDTKQFDSTSIISYSKSFKTSKNKLCVGSGTAVKAKKGKQCKKICLKKKNCSAYDFAKKGRPADARCVWFTAADISVGAAKVKKGVCALRTPASAESMS